MLHSSCNEIGLLKRQTLHTPSVVRDWQLKLYASVRVSLSLWSLALEFREVQVDDFQMWCDLSSLPLLSLLFFTDTVRVGGVEFPNCFHIATSQLIKFILLVEFRIKMCSVFRSSGIEQQFVGCIGNVNYFLFILQRDCAVRRNRWTRRDTRRLHTNTCAIWRR